MNDYVAYREHKYIEMIDTKLSKRLMDHVGCSARVLLHVIPSKISENSGELEYNVYVYEACSKYRELSVVW